MSPLYTIYLIICELPRLRGFGHLSTNESKTVSPKAVAYRNVGSLDFREARVLSAGTMCSGSDSPIVWVQALSRAVYQTWRIVVHVEHSYAVEAATWKQFFLKDIL